MLSFSYELNPPRTVAEDLKPSKTRRFQVNASLSQGLKKYYEGVALAVREAKDVLGEELTTWRDAVGSSEEYKETKKTQKRELDGEGSEGDEDENDAV